MDLQQIIIKRYKEVFPHTTLKNIAKETGIQQTRIFRILNGYEMKISEFQKFEEAINKGSRYDISKFRISKLVDQCLRELSHTKLLKISENLEHNLHIERLKKRIENSYLSIQVA